MKVSDYISSTIEKFSKGYIFTFTDFTEKVNQKEAVIKSLNRLAQTGKIAKVSKGKYYKPEITPFGKLLPDQNQIVKDLLEEGGSPIGYLTGVSVYPQLGLTTQISNTIQIGRNEIRPTFKRERYTIAFIKQKNIITNKNIPLLQLLDALRYIKKIPDANPDASITRLLAILKTLPEKNKGGMVRLAMKYPPATRALLGAMLDELAYESLTVTLYNTLNPITTYKIPGIGKVLGRTEKWNIR